MSHGLATHLSTTSKGEQKIKSYEIQRLTRHIFVADKHFVVSGEARFAPKSSMDVTLTQLLASFMPVTATVQLLSLDLIKNRVCSSK